MNSKICFWEIICLLNMFKQPIPNLFFFLISNFHPKAKEKGRFELMTSASWGVVPNRLNYPLGTPIPYLLILENKIHTKTHCVLSSNKRIISSSIHFATLVRHYYIDTQVIRSMDPQICTRCGTNGNTKSWQWNALAFGLMFRFLCTIHHHNW
jgi:hypothetical protein